MKMLLRRQGELTWLVLSSRGLSHTGPSSTRVQGRSAQCVQCEIGSTSLLLQRPGSGARHTWRVRPPGADPVTVLNRAPRPTWLPSFCARFLCGATRGVPVDRRAFLVWFGLGIVCTMRVIMADCFYVGMGALTQAHVDERRRLVESCVCVCVCVPAFAKDIGDVKCLCQIAIVQHEQRGTHWTRCALRPESVGVIASSGRSSQTPIERLTDRMTHAFHV